MDPALLTAMSGAILGAIGIVISMMTARSAATKEEINSLRATILTLTAENDRLRRRVEELEKQGESKSRRIDELEAESDAKGLRIGKLEAEIEKLMSENHNLKRQAL